MFASFLWAPYVSISYQGELLIVLFFSCVILPVISEPQTMESVYPQDLCYVQLLIRFVCKMCVFFLHNSILSQYPLGSSGTSICNVSQAPAWQIWRLLIPCCSWHLRKSQSRFLSIRVKNENKKWTPHCRNPIHHLKVSQTEVSKN